MSTEYFSIFCVIFNFFHQCLTVFSLQSFNTCLNLFLVLFMVSFVGQKLLSLIRNLCLFLFLFSLGGGSKKILWFMTKSVFPMFSSKYFIVPSLMLRSLIHFEFVYGCSISCCSVMFETPWTVAHQASLSFTISQSLCKLMSIESMMPSNHLIFCHGLLLLPSIFPRIKVIF